MFLFNLGVAEFFALLAGVSGVVTALYLLDRSRQKHRVATLRFWKHSEAPSEMAHRRKIQQPWSLLLQLVSLLLLLLALAQLRWGSAFEATRDHVLVLDTSAVMASSTTNGTLMDGARADARAWLRAVPPGDRVMLVRADMLATAATAFESNRTVVEDAIAQSRPGASALRIASVLQFARQAQQVHSKRPGEIVYAGAARGIAEEGVVAPELDNLRVLPTQGVAANIGIRKIGLRRSTADENTWEVFATVRNYGSTPRATGLLFLFGGAPVANRALVLPAGGERNIVFEQRTQAAGLLEARLSTKDGFSGDDRVVVELPSRRPLKVAVYSDDADSLRPLFAASARIEPVFRRTPEYNPAADADVVVLDRFAAQPPQKAASIWIAPPKESSPVPVAGTRTNVSLRNWRNDNPLGAGLRSADVKLDATQVFAPAATDLVVAEVEGGPAIVARPSSRAVVFGFAPLASGLKYELTTPLLFANILRWVSPEVFLRWELNAGPVGGITATLDHEPDPALLRVIDDRGANLPYTVDGRTLRFFSGSSGVVRVIDGRREMVYSLTIPEVADTAWAIPASAARGIPSSLGGGVSSQDLWQWLALLGGLGLVAEWMMFGAARRVYTPRRVATPKPPLRRAS